MREINCVVENLIADKKIYEETNQSLNIARLPRVMMCIHNGPVGVDGQIELQQSITLLFVITITKSFLLNTNCVFSQSHLIRF